MTLPLVGVLLFAAFIAALFFSASGDKKRTKDIEAFAVGDGFIFSAKNAGSLAAELAKFRIFKNNHGVKIENIISGKEAEPAFTLFDYSCDEFGWEVEHNTGYAPAHQSVVLVSSDKLHLPRFLLRRKDWGDKLDARFGRNDIYFDERPVFSKKYFLSGDEAEVRKVFNRRLLSYLEKTDNRVIEAFAGKIVLFIPGYLSAVKYLREFIEEGEQIYSLMLQ